MSWTALLARGPEVLFLYGVGFFIGMALYGLFFWRLERHFKHLDPIPRWGIRIGLGLTGWTVAYLVAQHPEWLDALHHLRHRLW